MQTEWLLKAITATAAALSVTLTALACRAIIFIMPSPARGYSQIKPITTYPPAHRRRTKRCQRPVETEGGVGAEYDFTCKPAILRCRYLPTVRGRRLISARAIVLRARVREITFAPVCTTDRPSSVSPPLAKHPVFSEIFRDTLPVRGGCFTLW